MSENVPFFFSPGREFLHCTPDSCHTIRVVLKKTSRRLFDTEIIWKRCNKKTRVKMF